MRHFFESYNLHGSCRLVSVGLITLFITSVNTTNILTDTNPEYWQYWKVEGYQERFYISFETLKSLKTIVVTDEATGIVDEYTFKEWFLELIGRMLHPDHEFFSYSKADDVTLLINEKSPFLKYYEFFGKLFGAAVYQNLFVNAHLSDRFYKMMLGKEVELDDIRDVNIGVYDELKKDQKKKRKSAKQIKLIVQRDYVEPVRVIMSAISNGFDQLVPVRFLKIFNKNELRLVLGGNPILGGAIGGYSTMFPTAIWKNNVAYTDCERNDYVIINFWDALHGFTNIEMRQVLQFVTGMSRLPVGGYATITPKFNIRLDRDSAFGPPKADIRFNSLTLYTSGTNIDMTNYIMEAIENVRVDEFQGVSSKELYGILPQGWQRWTESSNKEVYIYLNTDTGTASREDPRNCESTNPILPTEQSLYPKNLEEKTILFRGQLHIERNKDSFLFTAKSTHEIVEQSYEFLMNVKSLTRLHSVFGVSIGSTYVPVTEWLSTLFQKLLDPINKFFQYADNGSHRLQINPHAEDLNYFKFIGRVFGLSIIHQVPTAAYFTKPFYRLMLDERASLEDIETSYQNKDQMSDKLICEKYLIPVSRQMSAILSGLDDFVHPHLLKIFHVDELEEYLAGVPTIDVGDWRGNTKYNGFTPDSKTVNFFWEIVENLEHNTKERLLRFATGRSRISPPGFKYLRPSFTLKLKDAGSESGVEFEAVWRNQIVLPEYRNRDDLEKDLRAAIAVPLPFDER